IRGVPGVISPENFPFSFVQNAAFENLLLWIDFGIAPPHGASIQVDTTTTPAHIVRDAHGNALGGVRTPFVDVPIATFVPFDTVPPTTAFSGFCVLYGFNTPFDDATLATLYRNHGDFVSQFVHGTNEAVRDRFWLVSDAIQALQRAVHADVP